MIFKLKNPSFFQIIHKFVPLLFLYFHVLQPLSVFPYSVSTTLWCTHKVTYAHTVHTRRQKQNTCTQTHDTLTYMHKHTTHAHTFPLQSISWELYFQGGSKKLCLAQTALEQITLFDLLDFGLKVQRWPGKEISWYHVDEQTHFIMMSLCF